MDFKTRFQGKNSKISKDGGIDDILINSEKPINPLNKVTIRSLHQEQDAEQNWQNQSSRITYGFQAQNAGINVNVSNQKNNDVSNSALNSQFLERPNQYMQPLPKQSNHFVSQTQGMYQTDNAADGSVILNESRQKTVYSNGTSNQKTSFYSNMQQSRGPITPAELFHSPEQSDMDTESANRGTQYKIQAQVAMQGTNDKNSITMRMLQQKMTRQNQQNNNEPSQLYQANPFPGLSQNTEQSPVIKTGPGINALIEPRLMTNYSLQSQQNYQINLPTQEVSRQVGVGNAKIPRALKTDHSFQNIHQTVKTNVQSEHVQNFDRQEEKKNQYLEIQSPFKQNIKQNDYQDDVHYQLDQSSDQKYEKQPKKDAFRKININDQLQNKQHLSANIGTGINQGRTSQQLRQSLENDRHRNLANVSKSIMSPSIHNSENKQLLYSKAIQRPPSHPGISNQPRQNLSSQGLPPRQESYQVKRVESQNFQQKKIELQPIQNDQIKVIKNLQQNGTTRRFTGQDPYSLKKSNNINADLQNASKSQIKPQIQLDEQSLKQRASSIPKALKSNQINFNNPPFSNQNANQDSLFVKYGQNSDLKKSVVEIADQNENLRNNPSNLQQSNNFQLSSDPLQVQMAGMSPDALQIQISLMQQQVLLFQQQQAMLQQISTKGAGQRQPGQDNFQQVQNLIKMQQQMQAQLLQTNMPQQEGNQIATLPKSRTEYGIKNFDQENKDNYNSQQESSQMSELYSKQKISGQNKTGQSNMNVQSVYKAYNLKDFKSLQEQHQNAKLGGLGANIGTEEWERAQRKKEAAQKYAEEVRIVAAQNPVPKQKKEKPKEKTAREKALEFAKNVPKPQIKKVQQQSDNPAGNHNQDQGDSNAQVGEGARELQELAAKHDYYADELEKIKAMLE